VADASLRAELKARYPDLWARMLNRRQLMTEALGIQPAEELLPLTGRHLSATLLVGERTGLRGYPLNPRSKPAIKAPAFNTTLYVH